MDGNLISEEDIRTKIVSTWLRDHGFTANDLRLELGFTIRLGRSVVKAGSSDRLTGRCDYLVTSLSGKNLMVIEAKRMSEPLDDEVKEQAISYARLLRSGGIAPFAVITNGSKTRIFDVITCEEITGSCIPVDHPSVIAGYRFSGDDLALRSEALRILVSLTPENLIVFCRGSISHHMALLRGESRDSEKKYVPDLYTRRSDALQRIGEQLGRSNVVLVTGEPQVGKTNLLCSFVEESIARGEACLFYPAIAFRKGLLEDLAEDFHWTFGGDSIAQTAQRLISFLASTKAKMTIVVDGWNEAEATTATALNAECRRLQSSQLRFVISFVQSASRRLLEDRAKNATYIADAAGICPSAIALLENEPEKLPDHASVVHLGAFSESEVQAAYRRYREAFNVAIPQAHQKTRSPYILGSAMRMFRDRELPETLDEAEIIAHTLDRKLARIEGVVPANGREILKRIGQAMWCSGVPQPEATVAETCGLPPVACLDSIWTEAGVLAFRSAIHGRLVDFYYSRERDYVISHWSRAWPEKLCVSDDARAELLQVQNDAAVDGLKWFLKQRRNLRHLRACAEVFSACSPRVKVTIIGAVIETIAIVEDEAWLGSWIDNALRDEAASVRVEATRLYALVAHYEELAALISDDDTDLIAGLLLLDEDYPLHRHESGQTVLDALREVHWESSFGEGSPLSGVIGSMLHSHDSRLRRSAAEALGYIDPFYFCEEFADAIKRGADPKSVEDLSWGLDNASATFGESYYGSMCPGSLDAMEDDPELLKEEHAKMDKVLSPIIERVGGDRVTRLRALLSDLTPKDT